MSNSLMLQSLEEAVEQNKSLSRLKIVGRQCKWTNVATAILKGAAKSTSLTDLELVIPEDFTPSIDIVDEVRRANPKLELLLNGRRELASHDITVIMQLVNTTPHLHVSCLMFLMLVRCYWFAKVESCEQLYIVVKEALCLTSRLDYPR